ncbi:hypothetical protein KKB54_00745 [bacterium]|nr:hypothetical protein [bacterium]
MMNPEIARKFDDRKFMWDGKIYETDIEAKKILPGYKAQDFEARMIEEDGKYLVYTRREVMSGG